jgi:predicted nucleotidyltransferase
MPVPSLTDALEILRMHQEELRRMGVSHAAIFGSIARAEGTDSSDVDVLIDLNRDQPIGIFEYARLKHYIGEILGGAADVVNRRTLKPLLKDNILRDAVDAF